MALRQVESAGPTTQGAYRVPSGGHADAVGSPSAPVEVCPVERSTPDRPLLSTYHFGQSLSAALALLTSRGLQGFTMLPIASFLSPALQVRLPEGSTFRRASHFSVTRD